MSIGSYFHTQGTYSGYTELKIDDKVVGSVTYENSALADRAPLSMMINLDPVILKSGWVISSVQYEEGRAHIRLVRREGK